MTVNDDFLFSPAQTQAHLRRVIEYHSVPLETLAGLADLSVKTIERIRDGDPTTNYSTRRRVYLTVDHLLGPMEPTSQEGNASCPDRSEDPMGWAVWQVLHLSIRPLPWLPVHLYGSPLREATRFITGELARGGRGPVNTTAKMLTDEDCDRLARSVGLRTNCWGHHLTV